MILFCNRVSSSTISSTRGSNITEKNLSLSEKLKACKKSLRLSTRFATSSFLSKRKSCSRNRTSWPGMCLRSSKLRQSVWSVILLRLSNTFFLILPRRLTYSEKRLSISQIKCLERSAATLWTTTTWPERTSSTWVKWWCVWTTKWTLGGKSSSDSTPAWTLQESSSTNVIKKSAALVKNAMTPTTQMRNSPPLLNSNSSLQGWQSLTRTWLNLKTMEVSCKSPYLTTRIQALAESTTPAR